MCVLVCLHAWVPVVRTHVHGPVFAVRLQGGDGGGAGDGAGSDDDALPKHRPGSFIDKLRKALGQPSGNDAAKAAQPKAPTLAEQQQSAAALATAAVEARKRALLEPRDAGAAVATGDEGEYAAADYTRLQCVEHVSSHCAGTKRGMRESCY